MWTLKKFCCCCSLSSGVVLISVINLLLCFTVIREFIHMIIVESRLGTNSDISLDMLISLVLFVSLVVALIGVRKETKPLLIPSIVCYSVGVCILLEIFFRSRNFSFVIGCALYLYFVIIEISYYDELKNRERAIVLNLVQNTGLNGVPQHTTEQYPTQTYVPQIVPEEYRTPAPYAYVQPPYTSPVPQANPQMIPTPGLYYAEQIQTNPTAPPFPYGAPPPYVPVQDSSTNEKYNV